VAVVGYTQMDVLLEVYVTYLSGVDSVYHCNKATGDWKERYEQRMRENQI